MGPFGWASNLIGHSASSETYDPDDNGRKTGKGSYYCLIANAYCHKDCGKYTAVHGPLVLMRHVARCPEAAGAVFNPRPIKLNVRLKEQSRVDALLSGPPSTPEQNGVNPSIALFLGFVYEWGEGSVGNSNYVVVWMSSKNQG